MSNTQTKASPPALLSVREVAAALRLDVSTVYRMVARGTIGGVQFGPRSTVRIARQELEELLAAPKPAASRAAPGVHVSPPSMILPPPGKTTIE